MLLKCIIQVSGLIHQKALDKRTLEKGYQLKHLLKAVGMSKSTYYFKINKLDVVANRNKELQLVIKEIFEENKHRYSVHKVHKELLNRGYQVNSQTSSTSNARSRITRKTSQGKIPFL